MCSREKDVPAPASDAKGVADRRSAALALSTAPSGPPPMTTTATAMDLTDTATETLKTALSAPLPDSDDESTAAPRPRGRSGKQKRRAPAATAAARSSPIEKRAKQDFAPDADGFVPARRTARRMLSSTTPPTVVANSFDALEDAPDPPPSNPAPKTDSHLPPVVLQFRPPYGELQKLLRSWTTAVYTVKPAGRDLYRVTLRTADDYRRVTQEASERGIPFYTHASAPDKVLKIEVRAPVRPPRSLHVHSVAVLMWPVIVGVRYGSVPLLASVAKHQRHIRRSSQRDGQASLSRRQRQGRPPPPRLRRFLLPPHPRPYRHRRLLRLHHRSQWRYRVLPLPGRRPDRAPPTAGAGVTDQWAPNAQHRLSSSPRWTLTAKQPRPPFPAPGPRRLSPPLTWPTSSRSSQPW
ncbi:uncharacterized protein LOC124555935 [Schistocerca americana]|uniref:uncharacterized protein LOC124555935 n=1 Tax=Schistocerca americana TaxID=7009 RepID=UPI001F4F711A|nr:uncharacterized protein LOC124555935 [Schistocerca americana]